MTREQIVNQIRTFATNHSEIKSFFEGPLTIQTANKTNKYYRFMIDGVDGQVQQGNETYHFIAGVFGRVHEDGSNRPNVLSDTRQVMNDFIAYFVNNPNLTDVKLSQPVTITEHTDYSDDGVSGVFADVYFNQFQGLNYCLNPANNATPPPSAAGAYIRDKDTGDIIYTLYPGQYYDVEVLRQIIQTLTDPPPATIIQTLT